MPSISVIIPVYNGAESVHAAVETVVRQTFRDWELIVIDDGSDDSTLEVLNGVRDPRLRLLSYPNAGLAASRNRGVNLARGERIAFLDADDLWTPDKLERQSEALDVHPEAALVYSWTDYIDGAGTVLSPGLRIDASGDALAPLLLTNFLESGSNALVRRWALDECGGFDESLRAAEDWDLWLKIAARHPFAVVKSRQIFYRIHPRAMSADVERQEAECLKVIDRAFERAPPAVRSSKSASLANLRMYLALRALAEPIGRGGARASLRLLRAAVRDDPSLLWRSMRPATAFAKAAAAITLPSAATERLLASVRTLWGRAQRGRSPGALPF